MKIEANSVDAYLKKLPADRREAISKLRDVVKKNLPKGYEEGLQYGMIGYYIPLSDFPNTYNGQPLGVAAIASQKQHMAIYMMGLYSEPTTEKWFREAWKKTGKKLDMGKSCVRFKKLDDLPLEVIGEAIKRVPPQKFIELHEAVHGEGAARKKPAAAKKTASSKKTGAKNAAKRTGAKNAAKTAARKR